MAGNTGGVYHAAVSQTGHWQPNRILVHIENLLPGAGENGPAEGQVGAAVVWADGHWVAS